MSQDIDDLIIAVSSTLKNYSGGVLSHEDAKIEYKNLLDKYEKIKEKKKKNENTGRENTSQIEGLCYFNNAENYSLVTGIYNIDKNDVSCMAYYGDNEINTKTLKAIPENTEEIKENILLRITPDEEKNFLHNIYLYPLILNDLKKTVFASVSSSIFFSEEKFIFLGKMIKNIFSSAYGNKTPFRLDYFTIVSNEIGNYIKDSIDDEHYIRATLFVFNMLEKILSHMGIYSLLEVSKEIQSYLNDIYKHNSKVFTLSVLDYIVLEKINKNEETKSTRNKSPEFHYKNINLPYNSLRLMIDEQESIYSLWDKIMIFENYLSTGDIVK